ncbi:MAG TPA: HDIG domain-containing protein [Opitutaceae bacterium]|nr:HDIG domain-containing protein [Opitutaceae bacterium]
MSVRNQLRLLVGGLSHRRPAASSPSGSAFREFLEQSRMVAVLIFILTVAAIVVISSVGVNTINVPVLPKQLATVQVAASTPFSYSSEEKTQLAREQLLDRVPPVYRLEAGPLKDFEPAARDLLASLAAFQAAHPNSPPALTFTDRNPALAQLAGRFNSAHPPFHVTTEDLAGLLAVVDPANRATLFETGLAALREIYESGVRDDLLLAGEGQDGVAVFQIVRPSGDVSLRPVQSLEDALTFLRVSLAADGVPRPAAQALFRFFRNGVTPNLVFDREGTQKRVSEALHGLRPVVVNVNRGQTIIQTGERVTAEEFEMFRAYQEYLRTHSELALGQGLALFGRVLLVLAMVLASLLYIRLEDPETLRSNGRLGLLALVVIINLALVRMIYSLGGAEFFLQDSAWSATLPYVAPTALAPIIVAILIDAGSAIFMALLISIFTGVIYGNRLDLLVLTFLASLVAIFGCREARRRGRVVRAAGAGGLTVAAFAALIGIADQTPVDTLVREMAAGLVTGLLTGIAVVGFLPVLESLFKRTTDITLLELTDYNHPLLRRMQLEAPGTYHHSLVVAQLSENACNAIGANPLLARVCALFHDIGKTGNSAHFTENQRNRVNPHEGKDPLTSARIIMRHVPEGMELAVKHHLPRAVLDVIRQHHGTTRVRYFYERAAAAAPALSDAPYRYPGPKPQFKESAVISLSDGVEAASRTLRSATPEQLGLIIDRVIGERIADQQLAEAPLTFEDVAKVKNSFIFTLLNMLHSRVAYDAEKPAEPAAGD